jgi:hypothetical protein
VLVTDSGQSEPGTSSPPVGLFPEQSERRPADDETEWFHAQAQECERRANETRDASLRYLYTLLARQWCQLAERAADQQAA